MNIAYHIRPRYTPGSPAMIDRVAAVRLAQEEAQAYQEALSWSGNPDYNKAVVQGSSWIVWISWEARGNYHRKCLITGETWKIKLNPTGGIPDPPLSVVIQEKVS